MYSRAVRPEDFRRKQTKEQKRDRSAVSVRSER